MPDVPEAAVRLQPYRLELGQEVEVEVLAPSHAGELGPRIVEGAIVDATTAVVVIESLAAGKRRTRVPWSAVALVRDRPNTHPGL